MSAQKKRCSYAGCKRPEESRYFFQIQADTTAGGQDWSSVKGSVLCNACYENFKRSGTLERTRSKPLAASARRCTYAGCERPEESSQFHQIQADQTVGGQDWSSVAGSVLCTSCYDRFRTSGSLERTRIKPLAASARRCTYAGCERPEESSQFYQIQADQTAGGQDWSSVAGSVLCQNCYDRFRTRGTLEKILARLCTYAGCEKPEESTSFYKIWKDSTAGGQDWSSLAGSVLCSACYTVFRKSGTLERQQRPLPHSKAARADLKPLGQVEAEDGGRAGKRKAACQDDDMRGEGVNSASGSEGKEGGGSKGKSRAVLNDEKDDEGEEGRNQAWGGAQSGVGWAGI
jgi:predicted NAD-dependent protein-ADP-ribosyltransferase YbiA (DUF1768 family)